jgi:diguanylate cyclase (GGDEF)-like protein
MEATGVTGISRSARLLDGRALLGVAAMSLAFGIAGRSPVVAVGALLLVVAVLAMYWRQLEPWVPVTRSWLDERELTAAHAELEARDATITRQREAVEALVEARRALEAGADRQATVLRAARAAAGAAVALYVESQDDALVALASDGAPPVPVALGLGALCRRALETEATQVATGQNGPTPAESDAVEAFSTAADVELRSVVCVPVALGEGSPGVLALGLARPLLTLPADLLAVLSLLVGETARIAPPELPSAETASPRTTDELTGLLDRPAGELALALEVERAQRNGRPLAAALIDLDRFKDFTATRGAAQADALLTKTSDCWREQLRGDDILVRWDTGRFLLVLPGCSQADAERAVRQLRSRVPMGQTASIGFTMHSAAESPEQTLARADAALHRAKRLGRNRSLAIYAPRRVPAPRGSSESLQAVG